MNYRIKPSLQYNDDPLIIKVNFYENIESELFKKKSWFFHKNDLKTIGVKLELIISNHYRSKKKDYTESFNINQTDFIYEINLYIDINHQQSFITLNKKANENSESKKIENITWMFQELFDKIPFDIAIYDNKLRYMNVSSNAIKNNEVRDWIIGKTDNDYFKHYKKDTSIGKNRTQLILHSKKTKKPVEFVEQILNKNGTISYAKKHIFPVFNSSKQITNYLGFSTDITESQNFKNTTSLILNSIEDVIFELNDNFIFTNAWAADESFLFLPKKEFIGKRLKSVLGSLGFFFENGIKEVLKTKETNILNYKHPTKEQYFQARISLIKQKEETIAKKVVVSVRDVSKEKEKDKLIEANKTFINKLINYSDDIIFLIDSNYNLIEHNLTFSTYFKKEVESINYNNISNYIKKEDKKKWINHLKMVLLKENFSESLISSFKTDSAALKIEFLFTPIMNHLNNVESILVIGRNITKHAEIEKILIESKDLAEQNMKMKEQFLFNMSHEIRTPLNSISGAIHLLEDNTIDPILLSYISVIKNSSNHLLHLLNDILDLSKIETGKIKIFNKKIDINTLIRDTVAAFEEDAKRKKNSIDIYSSIPKNVKTTTDIIRLRQILFNIIGNSIKFTQKGKIEIFIDLKKDDTLLEIIIKDTGIGIEKARLDKIFNGSATKSRSINSNEGAGLGLNISIRLAELLKGSISVDSELGKGSTFLISIPIKKTVTEIGKSNTGKLTSKHNQKFNSEKILIVEDHDFNRIFLSNLLKQRNLQIDTAKNGIQALDLVKINTYDLILMDLSMPKMDGFEATDKIRKLLNIKTPILAITAHTQKKVYYNCLKAGMNGLIKKPYNPTQLFSKIKQFMIKNTN